MDEEYSPASTPFQTLASSPSASDRSALWKAVRETARPGLQGASPAPDSSSLETGLSPLSTLTEAPPRTLQCAPVMRSSPMSLGLRQMIERREFGRRHDWMLADLDAVESHLPSLECPDGALHFPASDASFEDLSLSVDCLLQHRKRLLSATLDRSHARRNVLVLGAGPAGLIAAIELRLRDHRVIVCEQRETYARNRFIGVYKEIAHIMAALGMPESMTYDFTHYRGKRGVMLADMQTFFHAVALKLGVILYTGAMARHLIPETVGAGEVELQRAPQDDARPSDAIGMVRWHHDTVMRVRSGVCIHFDTIVEATGGRSGLREILVGPDNVVSMRTLARDAARRDPSLDSCFDNPADHCAQIVESDYGCPPAARSAFASALFADDDRIPDEIPCLASNVDASIIVTPLESVARPAGMGARIGDKDLDIPRDWVIVRCPKNDRTLTRYQIEGPFPQSFEFGGKRVRTRECLASLNPVSLLLRFFYAIGVPFDAIDHRRLVDFYTLENTQGDTSDVVATWIGRFRGLRLGGAQPIWCRRVPGSDSVEYAVIGEALQNAWYRFGVGVDDSFHGAIRFARGIELAPDARQADALEFERTMSSRSVQVLYHLYQVNQNAEQGVVGPVLTECYMDRRYAFDLAESGLRQEARRAEEILDVLSELRESGSDSLLEAALEHRLHVCCSRVLELLRPLGYDPKLLGQAAQAMNIAIPGWRERLFATLEPALSATHRGFLSRLDGSGPARPMAGPRPSRSERLLEIALGRYAWVGAWVRACALRSLDPSNPAAIDALSRAVSERDACIAGTAAEVLARRQSGDAPGRHTILAKTVILKGVSIFSAIPHEDLARIASLVSERWALPGERILEKDALGDCLYVIASGRVRVHDGDRTLTELGNNAVFGELSLLDAAPRSASVTAVDRTCLLRLQQADFYALVSEHPEIMRLINRVLCQMIRRTTRVEERPSAMRPARRQPVRPVPFA